MIEFMYRHTLLLLFAVLTVSDSPWLTHSFAQDANEDITAKDPAKAEQLEKRLINGTRQLTFEGKRAGEGYFSADGTQMVFQSERETDNPFYQIYKMDLETGDIQRVSPGHGKTTCAWIHPDGTKTLFSSTHDDPQARTKQADEFALREAGKERRYAWDYDENFELYECNPEKLNGYTNLTNAPGYDAEGSWSPDGSLIAFASNRKAYTEKMTPKQEELFNVDQASMVDIYIMNADGSNVRQLTDTLGYDGGPFFSPDGKRICWRRFAENGATAEIMTMNIDGSDQSQLTRMNAMSWAPYYHPSGKYLIFTTNKHGFANFELYLVSSNGSGQPVRVTFTKGFDGLPVFSPNGKKIAWTSNRTTNGNSQIFIANWNHEAALGLLGESTDVDPAIAKSKADGEKIVGATDAKISALDIRQHVAYLCRKELEGRLTGTLGEKQATAYVAGVFEKLGLKPAGDNGTYFQEFEFVSGVTLGENNMLTLDQSGKDPVDYKLQSQWQPLSFSALGEFEGAPIVFAGYGIRAAAEDEKEAYDSFVHLDVKDKWVLVFRFMPEDISNEMRQHLSTHSSLRYKAMAARDLGARGLIIVNGPNTKAKTELIPLQMDGSLAGTSIPVISVTNELAESWLKTADKSLGELQSKLDSGEMVMGFPIEGVQLKATVSMEQKKRIGRNVVARLQFGDQPSAEAIVVGAHVDHLGRGPNSSSLAVNVSDDDIHYGADDNASGVSGMLEIAQYMTSDLAKLKNKNRDVIFAAWSGEEMGLYGSTHFVKQLAEHLKPSHGNPHAANPHATNPHAGALKDADADASNAHKNVDHGNKPQEKSAHADAGEKSVHTGPTIYPSIVACINMDMIGRMDQQLVLQGIGSSSIWRGEIERRNAPVGLSIKLNDDTNLPTDASVFYQYGVPILSAFTGSHSDYHTPRDTPEKLNYVNAEKIAHLMGLVTRSLVERDEKPDYVVRAVEAQERRANLRAWLGTVPDYVEGDVKGVKLSAVAKDGPADKAGVKAGDVITMLGGKKIENIYDYTYAIEALKIDKEVEMEVNRDGKTVKLKVTPGSRD
jgi:Tol biopolymer transport system component/Zn-dependent M28 family amino/carboxypeptidase